MLLRNDSFTSRVVQLRYKIRSNLHIIFIVASLFCSINSTSQELEKTKFPITDNSAIENQNANEKDDKEIDKISIALEKTQKTIEGAKIKIQLSDSNGANLLRSNLWFDLKIDIETSSLKEDFELFVLAYLAQDDYIVVERISKNVKESDASVRTLKISSQQASFISGGSLVNKNGEEVIKLSYVNVTGAKIGIAGKSGDGAISTLAFSKKNKPIHFIVPISMFYSLFDKVLGGAEESKKYDEDKDFPATLNLAYLGNVGPKISKNLNNVSLRIMLPESIYYYDNLVISPVLLKRSNFDLDFLVYDDSITDRLKIPALPPFGTVKPERENPTVNKAAKTRPQKPKAPSPSLDLKILSKEKPSLGEEAIFKLKVKHKNLKPYSQIYIVVQAANKKEILQYTEEGSKLTLKSSSINMTGCGDLETKPGFFRIKDGAIKLKSKLMFVGEMEAGFLGESKDGGNGEIEGELKFLVSPFPDFYDRIRLTPIVMTWDDNGELCTELNTIDSPSKTVKLI